MKVAYYSPFVRPDGDAASGAARMGMLLQLALAQAGAQVLVPDLPLTREPEGIPASQEAARIASTLALSRLLEQIQTGQAARPDAWFSYHVYYKSPDWIGPAVSRTLGIPYIVAEGSHAPKRAAGPWSLGHAGATHALQHAHLLLAMTDFDRKCLHQLQPGRVVDFKPFIDTAPFKPTDGRRSFARRLLAVGMMRDERKLESYRLIARTMHLLSHDAFSLRIAGDGKYRAEIEGLFHEVPPLERPQFLGVKPKAQVLELMASSDLFLWPGIGEAYGLTFLEAQASGLPVIACRDRGVSDVTRHGETAILCPAGDSNALAAAILMLSQDDARRESMRIAAQDFVLAERSLLRAGSDLRSLLRDCAG
jgi:glycosyltransferase involved in cell wall biosynthesis